MKSLRRRKSITRSLSNDSPAIAALCEWFGQSARDLPWRRRRTGYTALVSEVMLQQTQVSRVVEVYRRFMKQFPTVRTLAGADEQDVLTMWQGMGYYRRARNLHAAARMIVERFGGRVPTSVDALLQLPGVGRYTAGAIASIAFGKAEPIVDGNVLRVLARLRGKQGATTDTDFMNWAWAESKRLVRLSKHPGILNESLMELGATICLPAPASPKCESCPIAELCKARRLGVQDCIPQPAKAVRRRAVHHHAVVVRHASKAAMIVEQRPSTGMWSNMWQVPTIEADRELAVKQLMRGLPMDVSRLKHRQTFRHATTHRSITFHVFTCVASNGRGVWRSAEQLAALPMSNPQRRIIELAMQDDVKAD
jgi:A/G-specific adenine glycosylase